MTTKNRESGPAAEHDDQRGREGAIGGRILAMLGTPDEPCFVRVRRLWDGHYRVNVMIGEAAAFARIAHSYFVAADAAGNILTANPPVRRAY